MRCGTIRNEVADAMSVYRSRSINECCELCFLYKIIICILILGVDQRNTWCTSCTYDFEVVCDSAQVILAILH